MTNIETICQSFTSVELDGQMAPRDCYGIIDNATKGTDEFAYHVAAGSITRRSERSSGGRSYGHMFRFFDATGSTACGKKIDDATAGDINLFHTTKLCTDCAAAVEGLRWTRQFKTAEVDGQFVITEVAPTNLIQPDYRERTLTRSWAWDRARCQLLPVVFVALDGTRRDLGECFTPEVFEQAAYSGYVSSGFCMTDGYYAPIKFEQWVVSFRKAPVLVEPEQRYLQPLLARYVASLPVRVD